jgi:7-cyano-7-deazaguanine synthase
MMKGLHILVYSGGLDSTTLLCELIYTHKIDVNNIRILNFKYGQKHSKETEYAKKTIDRIGIPKNCFYEVDISKVKNLFVSSSLVNKRITIPALNILKKKEKEESLKSTVVPARNAIFLTIATSFADGLMKTYPEKYERAIIHYAAHKSDYGVYPDCRPQFVQSIQETMRLATDNNQIFIEAPFVEKTKAEIVKLGSEHYDLGKYTWSCYRGDYLHCGECSSCLERKKAFELAQVKDTTDYEGSKIELRTGFRP